jgi:NADH-quinone oxidoreductase subunit N
MTTPELLALSPLLILSMATVILMLVIVMRRDHALIAAGAFGACILTLFTLPMVMRVLPQTVTPLLLFDGYAVFYIGMLVAATAIVIPLSHGYLALRYADREQCEEFYLLLLLATLGGVILVTAAHAASLFLGFEILGVSLYSLIGYLRLHRRPLEAAVKYLLLSASASAFLLIGLALLYFATGTLELRTMRAASDVAMSPIWLTGLVLIMVGLGFKLGLVPFHLWIPDVYQGAPAPITAYVATVSKGAVFALLLRLMEHFDAFQLQKVGLLFGALAAASMIAGNVLALLQDNVKRLLAYSSIAHFGYLLVAFLAGGPLAAEAVTMYLVAYFITTLGAFGVVTVLSDSGGEAESIDRYRGLFWSHPGLSGTFMLMLLSLAGIPVTAGFIGKFYAVAAGVTAQLWTLVLLLVLNSVVGVYYYLRLIVAMFDSPPPSATVQRTSAQIAHHLTWTTRAPLGAVLLLLLLLGLYPQLFISLVGIIFPEPAGPTARAPF